MAVKTLPSCNRIFGLVHTQRRCSSDFDNSVIIWRHDTLADPVFPRWCLLLPSANEVAERQCFYTCLSVILFTGGSVCPSACWDIHTPRADTPHGQTPQAGRHPPPRQTHIPTGQTPLGRHPPGRHTFPLDRHLPRQTHTSLLSRRLLLRTVRILLECILICEYFCRKLYQN